MECGTDLALWSFRLVVCDIVVMMVRKALGDREDSHG